MPERSIQHLPISIFATVMGLTGFAIAIEKLEHYWNLGTLISDPLLVISGVLLVVLSVLYLTKFALFPQAVIAEFNHPIRLSFFPTITISLLVLAVGVHQRLPEVAVWMWWVGIIGQLIFTLAILTRWMHRESFVTEQSNPAWFIPIVGNVLVPVAGVNLGFVEVSWFFFSFSIVLWLPMLAIVLNRIFFHPAIPQKLWPTMFILIAPPAVAFLSWMQLNGSQLDSLGRIFYYFAVFTTLLLFAQGKYFASVKFGLPWWAYSFPIAAVTIASFLFSELTGGIYSLILAHVLLVFLTGLIATLVYKTTQAALSNQICQPE